MLSLNTTQITQQARMYAKIFEQIYDGTLCSVGPWEALVTFQQLLILADADGCVDMTTNAISRRTTIPIEIIERGVSALLLPDPDSRSPGEEGKRIIHLSDDRSWGWKIVNYAHYRNLRDEESRREYHRKYWHKRKNNTQHDSTDSTDSTKNKQELNLGSKQDAKEKEKFKTSPRKFSDDDEVDARAMFAAIRQLNPNHKPPNFEKWADEIRLIRERDNRTREEIMRLFAWANADPFWQANILSPAKLREKWDVLTIQMTTRKDNGKNQQPSKPSLAERATNARKEYERSIGIGAATIQTIDGELVGTHEPPVRP
jgi:hypothetical protein